MEILVTAKEMKAIDRDSIDQVGIPSVVLMERAALAVTDRVIRYLKEKGCFSGKMGASGNSHGRVLVLAGVGNNGADGLAAARMLYDRSIDVTVLYLGKEEKATEEWRLQAGILRRLGIRLLMAETAPASYNKAEDYHVVIDAVFGIGITRTVEGIYRDWLDKVNQSGTYVVSVDVASGLDADTGQILGTAIRADETVTFGCKKRGMVLYPGKALSGRVTVADVGFPGISVARAGARAYSYEKSDQVLPARPADGNKGTFGRILIAAGSHNMAGAACFSAKAALASGAGLVQIFTMEENRQILQTLVPEAILTTWEHAPSMEAVRTAAEWADVVVVGPGMGRSGESLKILTGLLKAARVPVVLDADALNLLAEHPELREYLSEKMILTPHPGELSRLTGLSVEELKRDLPGAAVQTAAELHCICVCKDAATVTAAANGDICINQSGNQGMAVGGSGDVLTGIIAGMLAAGLSPYQSAAYGVYVHGLAGDRAKSLYGSYGMGPAQIGEQVGQVLKALTEQR